MLIFGPPSFFPAWLNNAISFASFAVIVVAIGIMVTVHFHQHAVTNQGVVILGFVSAVVAFTAGALIESDTKSVNRPDTSAARVFTPRTPKELIDIVRTKTKRDAMRHKGSWIHVEGTVQDISEIQKPIFRHTPNPYIEIEVVVGWLHNNRLSQTVTLHVDADKWKSQVDKIEREDRLVAIGTVHSITILSMDVLNGEIISVSGSDKDGR